MAFGLPSSRYSSFYWSRVSRSFTVWDFAFACIEKLVVCFFLIASGTTNSVRVTDSKSCCKGSC